MPAKDVSPLSESAGPAIQMHPDDHARASSNGQNGRAGKQYRAMIRNSLKQGKWRKAMSKEILDVRRIASEIGDNGKYNEATLEMCSNISNALKKTIFSRWANYESQLHI
ncbi:hypothetical protein BPMI_02263c [Candidatus Burkholderia pumila]|uniref:Uncharacterized protein n=1 Tax=Candidatus Burkholderia pumila TaxID=1090375 RepID=A0ABR5HKR7_9BURK|nr:hypothetical protein BPMI_02263c [Candidatus Burkholderia pumila]